MADVRTGPCLCGGPEKVKQDANGGDYIERCPLYVLIRGHHTGTVIPLTLNGALQAFPAGTKMLFVQTAAPTGWTKDTDQNDKALRIVSGSVSTAGTSPFSTIFNATRETATHPLSIAEMPAHTHTLPDGLVVGSQIPSPTVLSTAGSSGTSGSTGSGAGHKHTIAMDLQYIDIIKATKD